MEKKNPYKFTLGFDKTKPTHVRAAGEPTREEHLCCKERQGTCVMIRQKNLAFAGVPKGLFICSICVNI